MTELIVGLFDRIDSLTSGTDETQLTKTLSAWRGQAEVAVIRKALSEWIETCADLTMIKLMARETSTHYVWPLHQSDKGYSVAINEFKDPQNVTAGYATTLHNHRYSFVSFVLSGGYGQTRSDVAFLDSRHAMRIYDSSQDDVAEGDIVTINHDEFHRLGTIATCTVTLVVKCPAVRDESLSVDTGTLRVTTHVPVESRIAQLMNSLAQADERRR